MKTSLSYNARVTTYILTVFSFLELADNGILPGISRALKEDLDGNLSDLGKIYLAQSLGFALSMPIWGYLGDRLPRKFLICAGCAMWGFFTIICAFATSMSQFMMMRLVSCLFMALIPPISQSMIADIAAPEDRGRIFGSVHFFSSVGSMVGQFVSTAISEEKYDILGGIRGWRLCLLAIGIISVGFPLIAAWIMPEPKRLQNTNLNKKIDWTSYRLPTFWLLICQGIFGCMPWAALGMYGVLWLEMAGYKPMEVAKLLAVGNIAGSTGALLAGYAGDWAHMKFPYRGRVCVAQISVFVGLILQMTLLGTPTDQPEYWARLCVILITFRLTAGWAGIACNAPLIADISTPESRASVYSLFCAIERIPASFAGYFVSYLAEEWFGFHKPDSGELSSTVAETHNADDISALTAALRVLTVFPWTLTVLFYGSIHFTYITDVKKIKKHSANGYDPVSSMELSVMSVPTDMGAHQRSPPSHVPPMAKWTEDEHQD